MTFRVRALDANGDMTWGRGNLNFLVDSPAAVAQCIATRLKLFEGEWYLDTTEGVPYFQQILGHKNLGLASALIRDAIMGTPFVTGITDYSFVYDSATRKSTVTGKVSTAFGVVVINVPVVLGGAGGFQLDVTPLGTGGGLG